MGFRLLAAIALALVCGAWALSHGQAAAQPPVRFRHHVIDAHGPADPWLKSVGDIDGDGRLDLLAGGHGGGGLVWYHNPDWRKQLIAHGSFSTDGEVADVDGDGDMDVVAISDKPHTLSWYENPNWRPHAIAAVQLHDVEAGDFDLDGDIDLVARNQGSFGAKGDLIHFFRQDPRGQWVHTTQAVSSGEGLWLGDIDGDGDLDAVMERVWHENVGGPGLRPWPMHTYGAAWQHASTFVAVGRINSDRRPDIALSPAERANSWYRLSWFEAPKNPRAANWREHVVDAKVEAVHHFVGIADFNGDGNGDIAAAQMVQGADPDEVKIYLNPGRGRVWRKVVLSAGGSHSMRIADLDGDGDMDLYGANWRGTTTCEWWENLLK